MTARKKRTIIEEQIPDGTPIDMGEQVSDFDVALESVEDAETLRRVLEEHGQSGASYKVYRQTSSGDEFCFVTDSIDEEFIQKNFGGGDFKIRVFINGKFRIPMKLKIAPRIESTNGNGHVYGTEHRHMDFLEKLVLAQIAGNGGGNHGPSISELTGALANLDSLRGKQESGMDIFQKGVSFAREILDMKPSSTGDWKSELISGVKEALPTIAGMIPGARKPVAVNPQEQVSAVSQATPEQQTEMIKQGLAYLKKQCLKNVDPDLIIEWVENNAEDYQPLIHMVLNLPFEEFVKIDAEIGNEPFKQWFTRLFDGLRSAFVPADSVGVDSAGDNGDRVDARDNGKSSKDSKPKSK
jgi:hypothetical protein